MASAVTLPPSLAFLVSNFHSLVTIKLDASNYLLWRIQVENAMRANGYYEYLEGTIGCPPAQIKDKDGNLSENPACLLWKIIDTQLLSCMTASLSQSTLPYVLGLHHTHELWESLSHRYNSLTKNHVQELKCKLYNITKTSTMEAYVDLIKEYSQKLAAAGSPLEDDDLIFHVLRGLPPVFNGFKSAVRTRGNTITFDEVLTMLNGEDLQLTQDNSTTPDVTSVLVATHGSSSNPKPPETSHSYQQISVPMVSQGSGFNQGFNAQQSYLPQQQHVYQQSRNGNKGRGYRGSRFPRDPCAICGRSNHTTNYCYYKGQIQPQIQPFGTYQSYPPLYQNGIPMSTNFTVSGPMSSSSMYPSVQGSSGLIPHYQSPVHHERYATGHNVAYNSGMPPSQGSLSQPQAHLIQAQAQFTQSPAHSSGNYNVPYGVSSQSDMTHGIQQVHSQVRPLTPVQPWYFDSGATHHITNSLQNLEIAQPTAYGGGIMVGNGSHLPVTHTGTGQELSSNSVQGPLSQGTLSHSELL